MSAGAGASRQERRRKRPRTIHDTQVVKDWFGEGDQAHDTQAPTTELSKLTGLDLYEDPYTVEPDKNVSFDDLPVTVKREMMAAIAALGPKMRSRIVRTDNDPTAIAITHPHIHTTVRVPEGVLKAVGTTADPMENVKEAHRPQLMCLSSFNEIEMTFAQMSVSGDTDLIAVGELRKELSAAMVHSVEIDTDRNRMFVIFEVDLHGIFFCAVELKPPLPLPSEYTEWNVAEEERLDELEGVFVRAHFFACSCA